MVMNNMFFQMRSYVAPWLALLFPLWSLPVVPGTFRPLFVYIYGLIGAFFFLTRVVDCRRLTFSQVCVSFFVVFGLVQSAVLFVFGGGAFGVWFYLNVIFLLGCMSYFGFSYHVNKYGVKMYISFFYLGLVFYVFVGLLELASYVGAIPWSLKSTLNLLLSGRVSGRLSVTSSEPAWASRMTLILLPIAYYFYKRSVSIFNLGLFCCLWIFFFASFSLSGVVVLVFAVISYFVLFRLRVTSLVYGLLAVGLLLVCFYSLFQYMKASGSGYYVTRFEKMRDVDSADIDSLLNSLALLDGSAFIRIGYPVLAFRVFEKNPMGVGVGRYGVYFEKEVATLGSAALSNEAVLSHIEQKNADQRNYHLKIFTEHGLFLSVVLIIFYVNSFLRLKRILKAFPCSNEAKLLVSLFCLMLGNMLQFASYAFPLYWLVPALINKFDEK